MDIRDYERHIIRRLLSKDCIGKNKYTNIRNVMKGLPKHLRDTTYRDKAIKSLRNQFIVGLTKKGDCIFINQKELNKAKQIIDEWPETKF